jgi:hypothetical protein
MPIYNRSSPLEEALGHTESGTVETPDPYPEEVCMYASGVFKEAELKYPLPIKRY